MATYTMSPQERFARAQALKKRSENGYVYNPYRMQENIKLQKAKAAAAFEEEKKNQNIFTRGISTIGDIAANVITGAVKGLEGIVDLGAGIVGGISGIFDKDFQEKVKGFIGRDFTTEHIGNPLQEFTKYSYTKDGGIIEGVASGIGQMLPAVAVSLATAGIGSAAGVAVGAASKGAQVASIATLGASAAGSSTEEAFNEGADYYKGLGYGLASGAVEVATEKMFGGTTKSLFGKGMLDNVGKSVAHTGVKRIAKNALEEGAEEVISEVANPVLKGIYKGGEAFEKYKTADYWQGVAKAGTIGSLTALAYSGTVGYGMSKVGMGYVGKEADINDSLAEIKTQKKKADNLFANEKLTEKNEATITSNLKGNYQNIETALKKASETKRADMIKKFSLESAFESDGSMKAVFASKIGLFDGVKQINNDTTQDGSKPLASLDKRYYTPYLRGNEQTIQEDLGKITANLQESENNIALEEGRAAQQISTITPYTGELSDTGNTSFTKVKKGLNHLNGRSGNNVNIVIVNPHKIFNGNLYNDQTIYLGADTLENGKWAGTLVHEYTHFAEGSNDYNRLIKFIRGDSQLFETAAQATAKAGYMSSEALNTIVDKIETGKDLTSNEARAYGIFQSEINAHMTETLLGNEAFIGKIIRGDTTIAEKVLNKINDLKTMFKSFDSKESRVEYKELEKAERLYLKAVESAGYKYSNRKIIRTDKDEVDAEGEIQYNKKESKKEHNRLINNTFPTYKEGKGTQANELSTRWAHRADIKAGDKTAISFNGSWYLIGKFDDSDLGYQIIEEITEKEYLSYEEEWNNGNRQEQSIQKGVSRFTSLDRQRNSSSRGESNNDIACSQQRAENQKVRGVGGEKPQSGQTSSNRGGDSESGSSSKQKVRFSLKIDNEQLNINGEVTDKLVALHNLSEEKLRKVIELGGFPMPSIAITKPTIPHNDFGDITVVFGKDSISPTDRRNKVYSRDAWTPTIPRIDILLNKNQIEGLKESLCQTVDGFDEYVSSIGRFFDEYRSYTGEYEVDGSDYSQESIASKAKKYTGIIAAYLKEKGGDISPIYKEKRYMRHGFGTKILSQKQVLDIINELGITKENVDKYYNLDANSETYDTVRKCISKAYKKEYATHGSVKGEDTLNSIVADIGLTEVDSFSSAVRDILNSETNEAIDEHATEQKLHNGIENQDDFNNWIWEKLSAAEEQKGIRNDKDPFLPSGNRRKFSGRHDTYNLGNIVANMLKETQVGKGTAFGQSMHSIAARLSTEFDSVASVKKAEHLLQATQDEDFEEVASASREALDEIIDEIGAWKTSEGFVRDWSRRDDITEMIADCALARPITPAKIYNAWQKQIQGYEGLGYKFTMETATKVYDFFHMIKDLPTRYFEAKPKRAVELSEIKQVLVPDTTSQEFLTTLDNEGISYTIYNKGEENARTDIIKSMDNVQFSRKDSNVTDKEGEKYYRLTEGQLRKIIATNTQYKTYTLADAETIINNVLSNSMSFGDKYGELSGKTQKQVVEMLWKGLNSAAPSYRKKVAENIADYIIRNGVLKNIYGDEDSVWAVDTIDILKPYLHSIDLNGIKGELKHRYDTDNSPYLLWGKHRGSSGIAPDQLGQLLENSGVQIDAINGADIFMQVDDLYRSAVKALKKKAKSFLSEGLSNEDLRTLRKEIAQEVLNGFDYTGGDSKLMSIVNKYTDRLKIIREQLQNEKVRNSVINRLLDNTQKLKDLKLGAFLNATEYKSDIFKGSIEKLAAIKFRGDLNQSGTRDIVQGLAEWYVESNEIVGEAYEKEIGDALGEIANGDGKLTTQEIRNLTNIVDYFKHFVETYNKVLRNGQYVEAQPIAESYIKMLRDNKTIKVGWFNKVSGSAYIKIFGDPMSVARRMDMYESGFYTEMLESFRESSVAAAIDEMNIRETLDDFLTKNKKYLQETTKRTIKYLGNDIPLMEALYVYMALGRRQAQLALQESGFTFTQDNETIRVDGFDAEGKTVKSAQDDIFKQINETDKKFIEIAKKIFNEECKERKRKTDIARRGYSNVSEDEYIPIRRANIAKSVDASTFKEEMNRVSNASFNKDTVQGAKQELIVEPLNEILDRHIHAVAQYANLASTIDEYNKLFSLDISGNKNKPVSVATESQNTWNDGDEYFKKLLSDIQGVPTSKGVGNRAMSVVRGNYAKYQLGFNPKVWLTQLSSFAAAGNILDVKSIVQGLGISSKDIDEYSPLAKLRNKDNTAAMAQGVLYKSKGKANLTKLNDFGDLLMKPIGMVDRFVVKKLFGACQVQVENENDLKIGTAENKQKAGELLGKVILETQQNSMATERSAAMRSGSEFMKTITMFSADAMKVVGRVIDSIGELTTLQARKKVETDTAKVAELEKRIKAAQKKTAKSVASLVASAVIMALIAQLFRTLYDKDDEEDNIAQNMAIDAIGNLLGGLPIIRDIYSRFTQGYEIDGYAYSALNDLLNTGVGIFGTVGDVFSGKADSKDIALNIKKLTYAGGQILGLPTRNVYNIVYGLTKRFSPSAAYKIDDMFYKQSYSADLTKAIENGDDSMIATITGIMLNENIGGIKEASVIEEMNSLASKGYSVLPRSIGYKITYEGEEITLTNKQREQFKTVYSEANSKVASLLTLSQYKSASEGVRAKAIKYIYDIYYNLALEDLLGVDIENKNLLFSEAIDIEKLAIIVAQTKELTADTAKNGKTVSGSKKAKVQAYVNGLGLSAVQKYMIMGYLGYSNANGKTQVKGYIQRLSLSKTQKQQLFEYSGYAA